MRQSGYRLAHILFVYMIINMVSNKEFKKNISEKKLIILGEIHGAEVNPKIIKAFVRTFHIRNILIEVESRHKKAFTYLKRGEYSKFFKLLRKDSWLFEAGLMGASHMKLFQKYLRSGMRIIPVKVEHKNWNTAEIKTAFNIKKTLENINDNPALLIVGHLHARRVNFRLNKALYKPLGSLLEEDAVSVQIRYSKGKIFNFKEIEIKDNVAQRFILSGIEGLVPSSSRFFDYFYIVPNTKALNLAKYK